MAEAPFAVTDCDGHILESIAEMAEFMRFWEVTRKVF